MCTEKISDCVDGGPSRGSSVCRPKSEDPHPRQQNSKTFLDIFQQHSYLLKYNPASNLIMYIHLKCTMDIVLYKKTNLPVYWKPTICLISDTQNALLSLIIFKTNNLMLLLYFIVWLAHVKILSEKIKLILIFFLLFSIKQHYESESIIFFLQMPNNQPTTYIKHFKMEV